MDLILHAKVEYTKQLQKITRKGIITTFSGMFEESKSEEGGTVLKTFQTKLVGVPNWSQDIIHLKYTEMTSHISEELFEKLIQAIVISNVKIFGAIKKNKNAKIEVTLPDSKKFAHDIYIHCARSFYQRPGLFENRGGRISQSNISKNAHKISKVIDDSIEEALRSILPFNSILEEYFKEDPDVLDNGDLNEEIDGLLNENSIESSDDSDSDSDGEKDGNDSDTENTEERGHNEEIKEVKLAKDSDGGSDGSEDEEFFKD